MIELLILFHILLCQRRKNKGLREKWRTEKEEGTRVAHQNCKYLNKCIKNLKGITCYSFEQRQFTLFVRKSFQTANF